MKLAAIIVVYYPDLNDLKKISAAILPMWMH